MSDALLASIRRLASLAKREGQLYDTQMIIGYGIGIGRGQGFDVFQPEDLDDHLHFVSTLQTAYDELVKANDALHGRVDALENRLEVDHVFVGTDMVQTEVPPEERPAMVDGITARDSTIEFQKGFIDKQEERIAVLDAAMETAKYKILQLEMDRAELAGLDAKCTSLSVENATLRYQIMHGIGSGGAGGAAGQPGKPGK